MTALGKLLAALLMAAGLAMMTWATGVYTSRPNWLDKAPEGGADKGTDPVTFDQLKAEIEKLNRAAGYASAQWGANLEALKAREQYRADRRKGYAVRLEWARNGNPADLVEPGSAFGKGFYKPVVEGKETQLYDLSLDAKGLPRGEAILGSDGKALPGRDKLLNSVNKDFELSQSLTDEIAKQRREYDRLSVAVAQADRKLQAMNVIRDSVNAELFHLSTFEVNVYETRETVARRERDLRKRLAALGLTNP
jgi:hypothetical protein